METTWDVPMVEVYNRLTMICECYDRFLRELQSNWAQCETSNNSALRSRARVYRDVFDHLLDLYQDLIETRMMAKTWSNAAQMRAVFGGNAVLIPADRYKALVELYAAVKRRADAAEAMRHTYDDLGRDLLTEQMRMALDDEKRVLKTLAQQEKELERELEGTACG
ncbi:hypothetical protein [Alicyclobacillus sendaiensis]|uniref:hypothetical protein n=1 Tax=Alicyclobacillus sendaiensis TaxID=192387 RepID=UPI0026F40D96|nr:hypothetical protein [Alicyclobacillus sendaiensis]